MTKNDQQEFVRDLTASVAGVVCKAIRDGNVPEEWDGHEFRALLAELFARATTGMVRGNTKRAKDYRSAKARIGRI